MPLIEMTSLVPLSLYPFIPLSRWSHEYPEETSNVKKSTVTKNKTKKRKHSEYPEETSNVKKSTVTKNKPKKRKH